jgi:hypothetical protein
MGVFGYVVGETRMSNRDSNGEGIDSSRDSGNSNGETEIMIETNQAYDVAGHTVEVHGIGSDDKHGAYPVSGDPYGEHVVIVVDGDEHRVPVAGVRRAAYDVRGGVPESVDMDVIYADGDELHAEAHLDDGSVVELYDSPWARDPWTLERFEDGGEGESIRESAEPLGTVIWEREGVGDSGGDHDNNNGEN